MVDAISTAVLLASIERLASRFPRDALLAMWAVLEAHRQKRSDLASLAAAAHEEATRLALYADASNECGPGFPRDDPGPWYWSGLASLTRAAALVGEDPVLALHAVDTAAFEIGYPSRALQEEERKWREEQCALERERS